MKKNSPLNFVHLILELLVVLGFTIGLFPFGYYAVFWWVIPLTVVNLILSLLQKNGSHVYTITNVFMGVLALIPFFGVVFRIIGILMSLFSASQVGKFHFS